MTTHNTMSNPANTLSDPYHVRAGDTLTSIAKCSGRTLAELKRFNNLADANRLKVGQTLYLSEATAFGISVLFLDSLRHPIANLPYRLHFDGRTLQGLTDETGAALNKVTQSARSQIEVWVKNADNQWQLIANTASGYGHKLITAVSAFFVVKGQTEKLPAGAPPKPAAESQTQSEKPKSVQAPPPKPTQGTPSANNPAVKTKPKKGPQGQSVVEIGIDLPERLMALFQQYTGEKITEDDWKDSAEQLKCEVEVLKAIAEVESKGAAFWKLNAQNKGGIVPAILFERHYFSNATQHKYDKDHPDISWPTGYRKKDQLGKADAKMSDGKVDANDIYSDYASAYLRLINAYRLDPDAALKSCSWGKFQIMGANFELCGERDVKEFIAKICASEAAQIGLLAEFIRRKPRSWKDPKNKALGKETSLWDAVKTKNWAAIAFNYNGPDYKKYSYDTNLKNAYEKHKKSA
jgi:LysM repeat protein